MSRKPSGNQKHTCYTNQIMCICLTTNIHDYVSKSDRHTYNLQANQKFPNAEEQLILILYANGSHTFSKALMPAITATL